MRWSVLERWCSVVDWTEGIHRQAVRVGITRAAVPTVRRKLPFFKHPQRRDLIRLPQDMDRLDVAKAVAAQNDRGRRRDMQPRQTTRQVREGFPVRHLVGLRDVVLINLAVLGILFNASVKTEVGLAPSARNVMIAPSA